MTPQELEAAFANEPALRTVQKILAGVDDPVVVELGACDGYHTRVLRALAGGRGRHFAFEPDPRNVKTFVERGRHTLCHFFPAAVGNITGIVPFHLATPEPGGAVGSSSLSPFLPSLTASFPWLRCQETIEVTSYRLDDFIRLFKLLTIDFLWMDVQGAEILVFYGLGARVPDVKWIWTEHDGGYEHSRALADLQSQLAVLNHGHSFELVLEERANALLRNTRFDETSEKTENTE